MGGATLAAPVITKVLVVAATPVLMAKAILVGMVMGATLAAPVMAKVLVVAATPVLMAKAFLVGMMALVVVTVLQMVVRVARLPALVVVKLLLLVEPSPGDCDICGCAG